MHKNIKIIIRKEKNKEKNKKNENLFFKKEEYLDFYKEFEYNKDIKLYDIDYILNKINNIINNYKYIFILFVIFIIIYLKR